MNHYNLFMRKLKAAIKDENDAISYYTEMAVMTNHNPVISGRIREIRDDELEHRNKLIKIKNKVFKPNY